MADRSSRPYVSKKRHGRQEQQALRVQEGPWPTGAAGLTCPRSAMADRSSRPYVSKKALRVQEVGSHEELQRDFRLDLELGHFAAVRVAHLVMEVLDHLFENGG